MNNSIRKVSKGFHKSLPTSHTLNAPPLTERVSITSIVNPSTHPAGPCDLALLQNICHGRTNHRRRGIAGFWGMEFSWPGMVSVLSLLMFTLSWVTEQFGKSCSHYCTVQVMFWPKQCKSECSRQHGVTINHYKCIAECEEVAQSEQFLPCNMRTHVSLL